MGQGCHSKNCQHAPKKIVKAHVVERNANSTLRNQAVLVVLKVVVAVKHLVLPALVHVLAQVGEATARLGLAHLGMVCRQVVIRLGTVKHVLMDDFGARARRLNSARGKPRSLGRSARCT